MYSQGWTEKYLLKVEWGWWNMYWPCCVNNKSQLDNASMQALLDTVYPFHFIGELILYVSKRKIRRRQIKMQFSYLHFRHLNILRTADELSRSNFFLRSLDRESSLEVRKMLGCLKCKYENAFVFADAFRHWLWVMWCIAEVVMEHIWNIHGSLIGSQAVKLGSKKFVCRW